MTDAAALRALDHLVLPTAGLGLARARLAALGFTVAPDGVHPFGTRNACVYFENGTFLEPLTVADPPVAEAAVAASNVFVARDQLFRQTIGQEGMSAAVFATNDAEIDHARFVELGISAGPMLEFSRPFVDASGASDEAVFRLAFAADPKSVAAYFFTCQRVRSPSVDRTALQRHANGVTRPSHIVWSTNDLESDLQFWKHLLDARPTGKVDTKLLFRLPNIWFWIASDEVLESEYEIARDGLDFGLRARAIQFECESLDRIRRLLDAGGIDYQVKGLRLFVPPAPGQGVPFIFLGIES